MNIESEKSELIDWINRLKDHRVVHHFLQLKKKFESQSGQAEKKSVAREFGSGKHIFPYVAKDFNDPLDDFNEYAPK
jgi:hypothetical protein